MIGYVQSTDRTARRGVRAPIPVLAVARQEHRLGGAGSVVAMLVALEAEVRLAAVVGDDLPGQIVRELLEWLGVDAGAVRVVAHRATTVKERLLGRTHSRHPQQMIRVVRVPMKPGYSTSELVEKIRMNEE